MEGMRITKVSADVLSSPAKPKALSPREQKRLAMEARLQEVIEEASRSDGSEVYRVTPSDGEKAATVKLAFKRVKDRVGAAAVNLRTVGGDIFVGRMPPSNRGRKPKAG
jgi:hypothetical protein